MAHTVQARVVFPPIERVYPCIVQETMVFACMVLPGMAFLQNTDLASIYIRTEGAYRWKMMTL